MLTLIVVLTTHCVVASFPWVPSRNLPASWGKGSHPSWSPCYSKYQDQLRVCAHEYLMRGCQVNVSPDVCCWKMKCISPFPEQINSYHKTSALWSFIYHWERRARYFPSILISSLTWGGLVLHWAACTMPFEMHLVGLLLPIWSLHTLNRTLFRHSSNSQHQAAMFQHVTSCNQVLPTSY